MRLSMAGVMVCIASVFAIPHPVLPTIIVTLGIWALLGGIGAPGLESHIAGLSVTHRGVLLALSTSASNLGVAFAAALAGEAYLRSNLWVAGLGVALLGAAVLVLRKPGSKTAYG